MWSHREGLNVRAGQSDSAQISIELGQGYDLDSEIEGLRSDVGRLKQVNLRPKHLVYSRMYSLAEGFSRWQARIGM